ncbi:MAG: hypothetical protein KDA20_07760 [Phycisphaerales bacterium]|nr:hypothetical protein [Phycisphaerales bacterium]
MSGRVGFVRLQVVGANGRPTRADDALLKQLGEHVFQETSVGVPLALESGFTAGEHLYDSSFSLEKNALMDGAVAWFGVRVDTNTPPAEIRRALRAQHEAALRKESGRERLNRAERAEAKDMAEQALASHLADGHYRRSVHAEVLWHVASGVVLCSATAGNTIEALCARFREVFDGLSLKPISAGPLAAGMLSKRGRTRELEDIKPSLFMKAPSGGRGAHDDDGVPMYDFNAPAVPWAHAGGEPTDFLGNEMLIWIWHRCETGAPEVGAKVPEWAGGGEGRIALALDRALDSSCAWGVTGTQALRGDAGGVAPIRLAEAKEALAGGKWPRKSGLIVADGEGAALPWSLTLHADKWQVSGGAQPKPEEAFETPAQERAWRCAQTLQLAGMLEGVFDAFLDERTSARWPATREAIKGWIAARGEKKAAAMVEAKPEVAQAVGSDA